jgi:hypothetical protein
MLDMRCYWCIMAFMKRTQGEFQDIRIRSVPVQLVRRLKAVLTIQGMTLQDWFMGAAALTADQPKRPAKDK